MPRADVDQFEREFSFRYLFDFTFQPDKRAQTQKPKKNINPKKRGKENFYEYQHFPKYITFVRR